MEDLDDGFEDALPDERDGLKVLGYGADQVAQAVKDIFYGDAVTATRTLKGAGYGPKEVANAIKTAWNYGINEVIHTMKAAGYPTNEVSLIHNQFTNADK